MSSLLDGDPPAILHVHQIQAKIEIKFANSLSKLYIRLSISTNTVDPEWPFIVMQNKDEGFPADTTKATNAMVLKNKYYFINLIDTLHCKLADNSTAIYIPILKQVGTIICYHTDLCHTQAFNLYKFLKVNC